MDRASTAGSTTVERVIVRLLGPVEVVGPLGRAVLSGRQRALVGLLALQAGTVVVAARLVDALWGEEPPRTAVKSLHSHVARVRQALGACGLTDVLLTRGAGYTFAMARTDVDVCRFEDEVRSAREDIAGRRWDRAAERLRTGLALWSGDPIQDGELAGWGSAEVTRLQEVRLAALEDLWDAELRLGHHAAATDELDRLLVRHPLRERFVELSMLALYRCGRQLDALEAYQRLRTRLAHELGVDPSPGLQRLHTAILRHDPDLVPAPDRIEVPDPVPHRPAQLPPRVGHFTGRADAIAALDRVLDGGDTRIAVVSGPGGMGKTALVVQWAHRVRDRFPDGQLFLDLRGSDRMAMTATDALTQLLRSLGVGGGQMPAELPEMTNLFRSLLDDKRVLIVLDNGASADQVLPLVPATTTSALVVTSRRPMTALATYHAVRAMHLEGLDDGEALDLLRSVVGADRIDAEPEPAAEIVAWCGRMPLALRIAAANLTSEPRRPLGELAAELAGADRLDALSVEGDSRSVRTTFASAYRALSSPAARLFRLLGRHPGVTFERHLAAAVAGSTLTDADRALAELADAYLVAGAGAGRYRYHDLIQLYAVECARRHEDEDLRPDELVDRLLDWYLGLAEVANRTLDRGRDRIVPAVRHPFVAPFPPQHAETLAFLDGERENLLAVVRFAAEQGRYTAAWQLTYLLTGFFDSRGRWADRVEICRLGLAAAERVGDPVAEGLMRSGLGVAHNMTRRFDEALDCLYPALELTRITGDRRREGHVCNNIATAYAGLRRFDEALDAYLQALEVHTANGDRLGIAIALNNIGTSHIHLGRPELSFAHLDPALRLTREIDNPRLEAGILGSLGEAYLGQGRYAEALAQFQQALTIRRAIGDRRHEVDTLASIGVTHLGLADDAAALDAFREALRLSRELADQHLVSVSLTHLAGAYLRRDELDSARESLRRAAALRARVPDAYQEATIHRTLAELAEREGHHATAEEHREHAIRLFQKANATAETVALVDSVGLDLRRPKVQAPGFTGPSA
jgi:DNA-binding SARP family transcriptional activator/Tfp pilus assembly protein PilF